MNVIAIIVSIFLPGVGTLMVGKIPQGIIQIVISIFAIVLTLTGIFSIVGIPIGMINWIWALVTSATPKNKKPPRFRE